jgi:oligoribonuclease NrnB/cAMP/cGMP phosphodiesterase (DHH superfamily)
MKIKIFTHVDLDAAGSVILLNLAFDKYEVDMDSEYFLYPDIINKRIEKFLNYSIPDGKCEYDDYDFVYITDISVSEEIAEKIENSPLKNKIVLLDHHVTADWLNKYDWALVKNKYEDGKLSAGTSLVSDYLKNKGLIGNKFDYFTNLVREYDTWEWQKNDNEKAAQLELLRDAYGLRPFIEKYIKDLKESPITDENIFKEVDKNIIKVLTDKMDRYIHGRSKNLETRFIDGYKCAVLFSENYHSELGNEICNKYPEYDLVAMINMYTGGVSLRTVREDLNLSEIAKKFGGGGHPKASGFPVKKNFIQYILNNIFVEDKETVEKPVEVPLKESVEKKEIIPEKFEEDTSLKDTSKK